MNAIQFLKSRTIVLPYSDIDTDQIIPARFLTTTTRDGLGRHLFSEWRYKPGGEANPDFVLNDPKNMNSSILVAGNNFGCGSSREHAPWALLDYGIRAVISTQIADIFRSNALKNGLLPIIVDDESHRWLLNNAGAELEIDVASSSLKLPNGKTIIFPIDNFARYCLLEGIDQLGYLQKSGDMISRFEEQRSWKP